MTRAVAGVYWGPWAGDLQIHRAVRSIVREFRPEDESRLGMLAHLPTQFQAFIEGTNIRVHVVGNEVFATEIECDAVDYRYGGA